MTQLISTLLALWALTGTASANPLIIFPNCEDVLEYADGVKHEGPYTTAAESAGGMSCISSSGGQGCAHSKTYTHSVGVTYTVGGGLSASFLIKEVFTLGADVSASKAWATTDLDAVGSSITCPEPDKGQYECGLQVVPKKIKTEGVVRLKGKKQGCGQNDPGPWEDYTVEAPHTVSGGENDGQKANALWQACIRSCGDDDAGNFDCDGVRSAKEKGLSLCPDVSGTQPDSFAPGWCTGHIIQRQRWQQGIGDKFMFDVELLDASENSMTTAEMVEVDENGDISLASPLPYTIDIKTTGQDNDAVTMCYADQCWDCPGDDGHTCSLGKNAEGKIDKNHGYEGGRRQGDFGFTCNRG